jgi:hypothetical protein
MSKRSPPWFWNTDVLKQLAWVLLALVIAAYAGRTLGTMAMALLSGQTQWIFGL